MLVSTSARCPPSTPRPRTSATRRSAHSRSSGSSPRCRRSPPWPTATASGCPYVYPDNELSYAGNFLNMMCEDGRAEVQARTRCSSAPSTCCSSCTPTTSRTARPTRCAPSAARRPTRTRALAGGGRPRSTARCTAAPTRRCCACCARSASVDNVPELTSKRVKDGEGRLMGFGHRVYKNYDPRAKVIKQLADEVFEVTGTNPLLDIAIELERIALEDEYFVKRKLYPNVDFYSGIIYQAMGFPVEMFPVLFAIPRCLGWLAQWQEMLQRQRAEDRPAAPDLHRPAGAAPAALTRPRVPGRLPRRSALSGRPAGLPRARATRSLRSSRAPAAIAGAGWRWPCATDCGHSRPRAARWCRPRGPGGPARSRCTPCNGPPATGRPARSRRRCGWVACTTRPRPTRTPSPGSSSSAGPGRRCSAGRPERRRSGPPGARWGPTSSPRCAPDTGRPLETGLRADLERASGHDLSAVRVHDGSRRTS